MRVCVRVRVRVRVFQVLFESNMKKIWNNTEISIKTEEKVDLHYCSSVYLLPFISLIVTIILFYSITVNLLI